MVRAKSKDWNLQESFAVSRRVRRARGLREDTGEAWEGSFVENLAGKAKKFLLFVRTSLKFCCHCFCMHVHILAGRGY